MVKPITVSGVAVEFELGRDWKDRPVYFATVAGVRRSFIQMGDIDAEWAAMDWVVESLNRRHLLRVVSSQRVA